jgi:hypothetical protein
VFQPWMPRSERSGIADAHRLTEGLTRCSNQKKPLVSAVHKAKREHIRNLLEGFTKSLWGIRRRRSFSLDT